jgi:hypothetical protein
MALEDSCKLVTKENPSRISNLGRIVSGSGETDPASRGVHLDNVSAVHETRANANIKGGVVNDRDHSPGHVTKRVGIHTVRVFFREDTQDTVGHTPVRVVGHQWENCAVVRGCQHTVPVFPIAVHGDILGRRIQCEAHQGQNRGAFVEDRDLAVVQGRTSILVEEACYGYVECGEQHRHVTKESSLDEGVSIDSDDGFDDVQSDIVHDSYEVHLQILYKIRICGGILRCNNGTLI